MKIGALSSELSSSIGFFTDGDFLDFSHSSDFIMLNFAGLEMFLVEACSAVVTLSGSSDRKPLKNYMKKP